MARTLTSPTRKISNKGEYPKFIGHYTCDKAPTGEPPFDMLGDVGVLNFDSISSLKCGIYLEWRKDVAKIMFEPRIHEFEATEELQYLKINPDFEIILVDGELEIVEAKYSEKDLTDKLREKLALAYAHFKAKGIPYKVVYREQLEADGFIETIILLRRYSKLVYSTSTIQSAIIRLQSFTKADLRTWRKYAADEGVSTSLLYYLLYHQHLPLTYSPLQFIELRPCQE